MVLMRYLPFFIVLISLVGCAPTTPDEPQTVSETQTLTSLHVTNSPIVPTTTPVPLTETPPLPTEIPTATPTRTATITVTPTPTTELVSLTVVQDSVCRSGPGTVYDIQIYLSAGDHFLVFGRTETSDWWVIHPDSEETDCWISEVVVDIDGDHSDALVLTPPSLPTDQNLGEVTGDGLYYYLISENTGGPIACGDNILSIYPGVGRKGTLEENVRAALNALLNQWC